MDEPLPGRRRNLHPSDDGQAAERLAERFLREEGLSTVVRNFRCRQGEVDLIMLHGTSLVFVEVRSRSSQRYGGAAASIGRRKRKRIELAARYFLARHREWNGQPCRFDAVVLNAAGRCHWIRGAFTCDE